MATYIENELKYNDNSKIEYCYKRDPKIKIFVGLSQKPNHIGKWTFLDENKNDTIYGNGCRFDSIEQAINYIKADIKSQIDKGETPCKLFINGVVSKPFIKIHDTNCR